MKRVFFRPQAIRELQRLERRDRELVAQAIERFAETGVGDVKMLAGAERQYRLRAGDYRIRFLTEHADIIRILHIRHRREAYR